MNNYLYKKIDLDSYNMALPGQWFIGVFCINPVGIYLAPVNIFEGRKTLDQNVLNNSHQRAMNRYASGAPGEREGKMADFPSYQNGNWLTERPVGQTHHTAVMIKNGLPEKNSYGFSLIKINKDFAQMKMSSNSLNCKVNARVSHNFSQMTYNKKSGYTPGTLLLPEEIEKQLTELLQQYPYNIKHIAVSLD